MAPPGATASHLADLFASRNRAIIKETVRRHINEVKSCYEQALARDPELIGGVVVQFTVAPSGDVVSAGLDSSTIANAAVESCALGAVRRWQFPKPVDRRSVVVSYPFVFEGDAHIFLSGLAPGVRPVQIAVLGTHAFLHSSVDEQGIWSNGMIRVDKQGLLLVDTAWTDGQTEAILSWAEKRFGKRWRGAVITHEHNDRDGGLGALSRRRIPIAALDLTVAKLEKRGVRGASILFAAKDGAFTDPRGFEAFYPGPGHAPDNIVLRFPDVLFGGCLIKAADANGLGFTGDADLTAWPAAVSAVSTRYGKTIVVPGHGAVDRDGQSYERTLELLRAVNK